MALHRISRGLDLPLSGAPEVARVEDVAPPTRVALVADDYVGMKPTMMVAVGDEVRRGQPLFEDKKSPGVLYTAPGAGKVVAVNRGDRRALRSVVIELTDEERAGKPGPDQVQPLESYGAVAAAGDLHALSADQVRDLLLESGQWTAIRRRPFGKVAAPTESPAALFVTAIDTNPHCPPVDRVLEGRDNDLAAGIAVLSKLAPHTYVCTRPEQWVELTGEAHVTQETFSGPHPAGNVGTHIHLLEPVGPQKTVWYVGYADALMIGRLFRTGALDFERVISLAGPSVKRPRLVRTRMGAATDELVSGELEDGARVVSGSVLAGRTAMGEVEGYLGRFHNQVSALKEDTERKLLGWMGPGADKFSVVPAFLSSWLGGGKRFDMTTTTHGSKRAIVPIGNYERVMPGDFLPTFLLRSLVVRDVERAEELGALELEEEDLALCTFVCAGKIDYGPILRDNLDIIEREG